MTNFAGSLNPGVIFATSATQQGTVRRIHDGIDLKLGDVALDNLDFYHICLRGTIYYLYHMIISTVMKIAAMREHMGTSLEWSCRQYINI